jgi:PTH1 family peptidyl-tRNA hydrolase
MKLLVGLGNPGAKYEKTRHNIGFLAIDAIRREAQSASARSKFQGTITEGRLGSEKIVSLKPMTYMNLSGQSVGAAMRFYRLAPSDIIVFHDELDLAPGRLKVKRGGGHAGHNGLRSLHEHIGSDFYKVRMGIGHPGDKRLVSSYVLHDFSRSDWHWIDPLLDGIVFGASDLIVGDTARFLNKVAHKTNQRVKQALLAEEKTKSQKGPFSSKQGGQRYEVDQKSPQSPFAKLLQRFTRS